MNFKTNTRGFTLIELLVVIAIIGILASVVLTSLNSARDKGQQAKITSQMNSARSAAENYFSTQNSYGISDNDCTLDMFSDVTSGMETVTNVANYPAGTQISCEANVDMYALRASWVGGDNVTYYWCVDHTGEPRYALTSEMLIDGDANCDDDNDL